MATNIRIANRFRVSNLGCRVYHEPSPTSEIRQSKLVFGDGHSEEVAAEHLQSHLCSTVLD